MHSPSNRGIPTPSCWMARNDMRTLAGASNAQTNSNLLHIIGQHTNQNAGADHHNVVGEDHIVRAHLFGIGSQIALPVAVVDLVNGAVMIHDIGHEGIAVGLLDHDSRFDDHAGSPSIASHQLRPDPDRRIA